MRKVILFLCAIFLFCQCSSTKQNIESAICDVYGSKIVPKIEEDGTLVYFLDYLGKGSKQDNDISLLKDKIDNAVNILSEKIGEDLPSKSDANTAASSNPDCLKDYYKWETPSIRVLLITRKCIENNGNDITIAVTDKG